MNQIDSMVGADEVKEQFATFLTDAKYAQMEISRGQEPPSETLHAVITGNPGTGKTRVARAMADVYYGLGLVDKDTFVDVSASDLIAGHTGQSIAKTKEALKRAEGGVLFIDEAHNLLDSDFGKEVVGVLTPFLTDHAKDTAVILGGYSDRIPELMKMDPGWARRFPTKIGMNDYNRKQRAEIARDMASKDGYKLEMPEGRLQELVGDTDPLQNAGSVENLLARARKSARKRALAVYEATNEVPKKVLLPEDFT